VKENKKEKVPIWMYPDMVRQIDAVYPLHEISSRSEFVCKAVEFYLGFLQTKSSQEYINKTTLAFLENQLGKLEARVCRQLFRMCVEQSMAAHLFASQLRFKGDGMESLRKKCVKDVKNTIGNIRFDGIYAYQHPNEYRNEG